MSGKSNFGQHRPAESFQSLHPRVHPDQSGAMAGVVTEVNSLVDLISRSVAFAGRVGEGYYRASREQDTFPELVEALRRKQGMWEGLLRKYGMSGDDLVRADLEAAVRILKREEKRMEGMKGGCCGRGFRHKLFFPADLEFSIKRVVDAFDALHQKMEERDDLNDLFEKVLLQKPATLSFSHDRKYVPLTSTIGRVHEGLTRADGPRVVTLHGGPGTGKSTLARYMALCYQDQALLLGKGHTSLLPGEGAKIPFRDGVFFLACGAGAEVRTTLAELLQSLGSNIHIEEDPGEEPGQDGQGQRGAAYHHSESTMHKKLHARLAEQEVLIILDDVWDSRVIQGLLVPGKGVKYLITTQRAGLWGHSVRISIETPELEAARTILLNHVVGLHTAEDLPTQVQVIADDIISASESNPLILANLALAINGQRAADVGEWELKRNSLLDFLELEGDDDGPVRFDVKYPISVSASMMVAVNSLQPEAKAILYMVSLCEGPSVPENVVRVFFKSVYGRLSNFVKWTDYLEDHSLIRIQTQTVPGSPVYCRSWSVHGTRKHFILKERAEVMKIILTMLKGGNHAAGPGADADLILALCYVYVDKSLMQEFTQKGGSMLINPADSVWLRPSIQPLVWLLQMQLGRDEHWQWEAHEHARKIILCYVGDGDLDDSSTSSLLELSQTASTTCWALQEMALAQEHPLLLSNSEHTLNSLLDLLAGAGNPTVVQRRATEALGALAENNQKYILSHQRVLETFLTLLCRNNSSPVLQECLAWGLGSLAGCKESRDTLGACPGLVATLLGLQSKDKEVHFRVRRSASYALIQLTTDLWSSKPVLEALIELLASDVNHGVQEEAAKCVARLASSAENQVVIATHPKALKRLFGMLLRTTTPETKTYACMCLAELSLGWESRTAIKAFPDSMTVLEGLLAEDVRDTLQTLAAMCLASLHHSEYVMFRTESLRASLSSTVRLLMSDEEPDDNIYFSLREEANHRELHKQPW